MTTSAPETAMVGQALGKILAAAQGPGDVLLIDGPLGAGKTTLVRAIAAGMGLSSAPVSSPTFVLIHDYEAPEGCRSLVHVDAYRLESPDELDALGWDRVLDRIARGEAALVVEWAQRLGDNPLAEHHPAHLRIEHAPSIEPVLPGEDQDMRGTRELHFHVPDSWAGRPGFATLAKRHPARCPLTGQHVPPDSPTYPFSSERARLADLYQWFSGSYQITRPIEEQDLEDGID